MKNKVLSVIEKYNMLSKGDNVIVALSGGADSVCLLHILISLKEQLSLNISAAHLNHKLRGQESQRDLNFVRALCNSYNIRLFEKEADIKEIARKNKESLELCGRNARYDFFHQLAETENAKIATAHTASDNLETIIYNIARGTSINGLKGIVPKRNYIIRPLIGITRTEVEKYCLENGLEYVTDSSNNSDDYTRNKIRHHIVPVLKNINNAAESSAYALSEDAQEICEFLNEYAKASFNNAKTEHNGGIYYNAEKLRKLSPVVQKYGVYLLCRALKIDNLTRKHVDLLLNIIADGGQLDLNSSYQAVCSQNMFRILKKEQILPSFEPVTLCADLCFDFSDKEYCVKKTEISGKKIYDKNLINYSILGKSPVLRLRQPGDYIILPKRNVKKSLKKFLIEEKIPKEQRDRLLVLALGSEILWLEGFGASKTALPEKGSANALEISVTHTDR